MIVDTLAALEAIDTASPAPASTVKVAGSITPDYAALIDPRPSRSGAVKPRLPARSA